MAAPPIYNPVIPCVHPIPAGMYPGRMIRVQGSCPPGAQRFAINLQCGPNTDPRDDIALHLNFRFPEMCVVRNHLTAMNWGVEETNGGMPINRGDQFEVLVLCEPHSLKVALNGVHFCEFPHRIPFQRISHLTVDGDVMIQLISYEGAQPPPQQMYMSEPPAYGAYGQQGPPPPAYGAPGGYGQGQVQPPRVQGYGGTPQGFVPQQPQYPQQPQMVQGGQMQQGQQMQQGRQGGQGMGALGAGAAGMAAGGLAGYMMGGGFNQSGPSGVPASSFSESVDFGGDDWMD